MLEFSSQTMRAIGEAMVELAPLPNGDYRRGFAGDTFNTAWHLAQALPPRLSGQASVGFVTRVGQDRLSADFIAEMAADGLDVSAVARDPDRTMGLYLIELDGVERSFHYWRDTSAARGLASDTAFLARALQGAGLIHLSGITLAILPPPDRETLFAALGKARRQGARLSFDPNYRPRLWHAADDARRVFAQMLTLTDIALPSFDDEQALWGDANPLASLTRLAALGPTEIAVKDGARAVTLLSDGQITALPTAPVTDIRDTTGAGDGFNAGYLAARLSGQTPRQAAAFGQTFAAEVIRHPGARLPKAAAPKIA